MKSSIVGRVFLLLCLCCLSANTALCQDASAAGVVLSWEVTPIGNSAELLTLFHRSESPVHGTKKGRADLPLLSVVRDTLGYTDTSVSRLRYVWLHTYATPSIRQRIAASVPFLYSRFGNAPRARDGVPAIAVDLATPKKPLWEQLRSGTLSLLPSYPQPLLFQATLQTYTRNRTKYRNSQFSRATSVLDLYEHPDDSYSLITAEEVVELKARLSQVRKFTSQFIGLEKLEEMHLRELNMLRLDSARNWELLRQRSEAEGLYFDPLLLPDGTATHALLWVAKGDLETRQDAAFNGRFLNIANPWRDKSLKEWTGLTETRYFDSENRIVDASAPTAKPVELIPLALYGLDHPKIPLLLIDFRSSLNAKRRELSAHARTAVTDTLAPASLLVKAANAAVHFVTRRNGRDLFQPSRSGSYSQLKMLLAFDSGLSAPMQFEIAARLERVAGNPLENDVEVELELARTQYEAVLNYASQPGGLPAQIDLDRRSELVGSSHSGAVKGLFKAAEIATFGIFKHREPVSPNLRKQLATQRRNESHLEFLRNAARSGPKIEIEWETERVRSSLQYIVSSTVSQKEVASLAVAIFSNSADESLKRACLDALSGLDPSISANALAKLRVSGGGSAAN
jgi:hypothetical protein